MINHNHINPYKSKLRADKFKYSTSAGLYKTTHYVKVPFIMPALSSSKIITYSFHVHNVQSDSGIGYGTILVHDLVVQLGLKSNFGRQILEWDKTVIPKKDPVSLIVQPNLNKRGMLEVVIQNLE